MTAFFKTLLRKLFICIHWDITKNLAYDRLTKKIISQLVTPESTCIDIGAHKGEILDLFIQQAPLAKPIAFEPIPYYTKLLERNFGNKCTIYGIALSDYQGESTFNYVRNAPAYSGLLQRHYKVSHPDIEEIQVQISTLDKVLGTEKPIHFIKIDVEGGEYPILQGGKELIAKWQPYIIFECGLGASDIYGTTPKMMFDYFTEMHMHISLLQDFLKKKKPLTEEAFCTLFYTKKEYYFLAHKEL